jgi:hypothetical protein
MREGQGESRVCVMRKGSCLHATEERSVHQPQVFEMEGYELKACDEKVGERGVVEGRVGMTRLLG